MGDGQTDTKSSANFAEGDLNSGKIVCELCSSVILLPDKAKFCTEKMFLPHMKKKSEASSPSDGEDLEEFWVVDDMFTFENVGFSNTVENIKYLICADCEIGPIGYHDIRNKTAFYIAHDRIRYQT